MTGSGAIKRLVMERGFGFLSGDDGKEYFFHRSGTIAVFDDLHEGDLVAFEVESSPKGPRACGVQRVAPVAPETAA